MNYRSMDHKAIETLRMAGIVNPQRLTKIIKNSIDLLQLELTGLTVLTEAASGPYVVTPIIASLAGADVLALTTNSHYATVESVIEQTQALETLCGLKNTVKIYAERHIDLFAQADIVTNLGFVRPINAEMVQAMKPTTVIPLMCEAWEFREKDVDLKACREKGIIVVGTNEDCPGLNVFDYVGWLCIKMLFEAQIEIHKNRILVVSTDKFGKTIKERLTKAGADACLVTGLSNVSNKDLGPFDAIVVCDYSRRDLIIGSGGDISPPELADVAPNLTVIQIAGCIDVIGLEQEGIFVFPGNELLPQMMVRTLADLGPRPVVELHAAGLKVGELVHRHRTAGNNPAISGSVWLQLIQQI